MNRDNRVTMPPAELKRIREKYRLSLDQFAIELGYEGNANANKVTMRRFESGKRGIPLTLAKLVWMIDIYGIPDTWPRYLEARIETEEMS